MLGRTRRATIGTRPTGWWGGFFVSRETGTAQTTVFARRLAEKSWSVPYSYPATLNTLQANFRMRALRDLVYFDFEKAASLLSQLEGGLPDRTSESTERAGDQRNVRTYELLKLFKAEFGGITSEKTSVLESRLLHHDLLNRVEAALEQLEVMVDLNEVLSADVDDADMVRQALGDHDYVRSEGWAAFEDYERLDEITSNFNDLVAFVTRCSLGEVESLQQLREQVAAQKASGKAMGKQAMQHLRAQERALRSEIESSIRNAQLPQWLFEGLRLWISIYLNGRLNLRLFPFETCPEFELIANLKRDCFVDDNLGHLMYGYGTYPNRRLTVLGLITSTPGKDGPQFDASATIRDADRGDDAESMETAFRKIFAANDSMEKFFTFHRYPRIVVHPIAVFRGIKTKAN
jgi:hypothetical protein